MLPTAAPMPAPMAAPAAAPPTAPPTAPPAAPLDWWFLHMKIKKKKKEAAIVIKLQNYIGANCTELFTDPWQEIWIELCYDVHFMMK